MSPRKSTSTKTWAGGTILRIGSLPVGLGEVLECGFGDGQWNVDLRLGPRRWRSRGFILVRVRAHYGDGASCIASKDGVEEGYC